MKRKIIKSLIVILAILIAIVGATIIIIYFGLKPENEELFKELAIGVGGEILVSIIIFGLNVVRLYIINISEAREYTYKSEYKNKRIRLSFAYLIRIRVNNKYLLVKSGHDRQLYGPVGGVYHIEHTEYVYHKLGFVRDKTPGDSTDIRGTILGKNIKKFIKWFEGKESREITPNREFEEEIINSGIASKELFPALDFKFIRTYYRGIEYDSFYDIDELCRFDVYELILNEQQVQYFEKAKKNKDFILATSDDIKTFGVNEQNDRRSIGTQTIYILEE